MKRSSAGARRAGEVQQFNLCCVRIRFPVKMRFSIGGDNKNRKRQDFV
jgi:hypothetical protein